MQFQVARLQEIINKIKLSSKLNFKNSVDVDMILEVDGLQVDEINKLIGAGITKLRFKTLANLLEIEPLLLPSKKHYSGDFGESLNDIFDNFDVLDTIQDMEIAKAINLWSVKSGKSKDVLVQINAVNEEIKYGILPKDFNDFVWELSKLFGIKLRGISCFVPNTGNQKLSKTILRKASVLYKLMHSRYRGVEIFSVNAGLGIEDLVGDGANMIRIGVNSLGN